MTSVIKKIIKKSVYLLATPFILLDYFKFKKLTSADKKLSLKISDFHPCLLDKTIKTGFDSHYVYHTSWAARKVKEINPPKHIDISSSLYFSGIVSAFIPIDFYDYRPANLKLSGLKSMRADLNTLPFADASVVSISCMHTVEHIGLGRYGDKIDPNGDAKAIAELKRVVSKNGSLLFVVPVGAPKIEFNAHRIYSYEQISEYFSDMKLREFSLITDEADFIENADPALVKEQKYACGCFWFTN
jgi:SAM-dependent methyltransferase